MLRLQPPRIPAAPAPSIRRAICRPAGTSIPGRTTAATQTRSRTQRRATRIASYPYPLKERSDVTDLHDLVTVLATRRDDVDHVAGTLAHQGARDRRSDGDASGLDVGLVFTNDLVADALAAVLVFQLHGGAEDHPAVIGNRRRIDDFRGRELGFDLTDAAFDEALLLARRVVLGILGKIAVAARFGNGLDDPRTVFALEALELGAQRFGAAQGHRSAFHVRASLCRSWSRLTSTASRCSRASQVASAPASVV